MMRLLITWVIGFSLFGSSLAQAEIDASTKESLCAAVVEESELVTLLDDLIYEGKLDYESAEQLFTVTCSDVDGAGNATGKSLLALAIDGQQAENLEAMVIDLGIMPDEKVVPSEAGKVSVNQWMKQYALKASPATRQFIADYLRNFGDDEFNPLLLTKR